METAWKTGKGSEWGENEQEVSSTGVNSEVKEYEEVRGRAQKIRHRAYEWAFLQARKS